MGTEIRTGQRDSWLLARNEKRASVESAPESICDAGQGFMKGVQHFMENYAKIRG